jgi:hypothetical protein
MAAMRGNGSYGTEGAGRDGHIGIAGHACVSGYGLAPAVMVCRFPGSSSVVGGSEDEAFFFICFYYF